MAGDISGVCDILELKVTDQAADEADVPQIAGLGCHLRHMELGMPFRVRRTQRTLLPIL
jgi:hypothetical protein